AGDINSDNLTDLAVISEAANQVSVMLASAPGTFSITGTRATGRGPRGIAIVDLNHDGRRDVVTANRGAGDGSMLLMTNAGLAPAVSIPALPGAAAIAAADVNGDGKPDLLVAGRDDNRVAVLLNMMP